MLRQTDREVLLSRILEKAIHRSNALDAESLCIFAGQKCWSVRADVHVTDHDGGLVDASCIAVIAALRHFRRPEVAVNGQDIVVFTTAEREAVPLAMLHYPLCVSMSFFHGGETVLLDATLLEQQISDGEMIVTANRYGEVCQIAKIGGVPTDALQLMDCIETALRRIRHLDELIAVALDRDTKQRDVGGLIRELAAENPR